MSRLLTADRIAAAATVEQAQPALLADCLTAVARIARKRNDRHADDVAAIAGAIVAACLPSQYKATAAAVAEGRAEWLPQHDDARRALAYAAARRALAYAASDVAEQDETTISLEALADAEVTPTTDLRSTAPRPFTPRPEALAEVTEQEVYAGAVARILPSELAEVIASIDDDDADHAERLRLAVSLSDLPHSADYAEALAAWHALTTDAETGRPLARRGRPLTLAGALAIRRGMKRNDRALAPARHRIAEAQDAARAALADARQDPWHIGPQPQRHTPSPVTLTTSADAWHVSGRADVADLAHVERPRQRPTWTPEQEAHAYALSARPTVTTTPHTSVPGSVTVVGPHRSTMTSGAGIPEHGPASLVWTRAGSHVTLPEPNGAHRTYRLPVTPGQAERYEAARAAAQDTAYATVRPLPLTDDTQRAAERVAERIAASAGPVRKPSSRKKAGTGSTGPTVPARMR